MSRGFFPFIVKLAVELFDTWFLKVFPRSSSDKTKRRFADVGQDHHMEVALVLRHVSLSMALSIPNRTRADICNQQYFVEYLFRRRMSSGTVLDTTHPAPFRFTCCFWTNSWSVVECQSHNPSHFLLISVISALCVSQLNIEALIRSSELHCWCLMVMPN